MKINALLIARLCSEFREALSDSEIVDLKKDESRKTITIHLLNEARKFSLIFHFGMSSSYVYSLDYFPRKIVTTNFLPQLRGCLVRHIRQPVFDRIIRFDLAGADSDFSLLFELFGHSSNLYLLNNKERVITTLRKAKQDIKNYILPESPAGFNPLEFNIKSVAEFISQNPDTKLSDIFTALDDEYFRDLFDYLNLEAGLQAGELKAAEITAVLAEIQTSCNNFANCITPFYYQRERRRMSLFERPEFEPVNSLADLLAELSSQEKQPVNKISEKKRILEQLKRAIKRDSKKIEKLTLELERARSYSLVRKKAEILSANLHLVKAGMDTVQLADYECGEDAVITIELSRSLTPGQNVENLYAKTKKLQDKIPAVKSELDDTADRLSGYNIFREKLEKLESADVPEEIKTGLCELGLKIISAARTSAKEAAQRIPYKQYTTSLGDTVLVGKSASDNDQLTFKVARKYDLWFHSQQTAGSHVVLRRPNRTFQFQKASIVEAAQIAAFFSTAKGSESVPVIYTEARYVRKARKGKPGQVLVDRTKSILVVPHRPKN